jgi:ubiquitin C-terminal hydrolase
MSNLDIIYINNMCKDIINSYQLNFIEDTYLKNFIYKVIYYILNNNFNKQIKKKAIYIQKKMSNDNNIKGLINYSNSCYMDSVLIALFATENYFVKKLILKNNLVERNVSNTVCYKNDPSLDLKMRNKIKIELIKIYKRIHYYKYINNEDEDEDDSTCSSLRYLLGSCENGKRYFTDEQQDVDEFLRFLLSIFDVDVATTHTIIYYKNNDIDKKLITNKINNNDTIIIPIEYKDLFNKKINFEDNINKIELDVEHDELIKYNNKTYLYKDSIYKYIDSPYLIFTIPRKQLNYIVNTPVNLNRYLDNKYLLISIVIFNGTIHNGHYTTYFLSNGRWYYYDDIYNNINLIGNYEQLLISQPSPITNGVQYYYIKIN